MINNIRKYITLLILLFSVIAFVGCGKNQKDEYIYGGYSEKTLSLPNGSKYNIAGYSGGRKYTGVIDEQKIKAFYLNYYGEETLLISIDCIGLTSEYVKLIREKIELDFAINVISTHTHAGVDTMGLWGEAGINGKDELFMDNLVENAVEAGIEAYSSKKRGILTYGYTKTKGLLRDSREPYVFDENIYQIKFIPNDKTESTRLVFFGAHAESLGGNNTKISADFPSVIASTIKKTTKDNMIYFPGAIGGLIATTVFDETNPENNMKITGEKLASYILNIEEENISFGKLKQAKVEFKVKLENTLFLYFKFLGILKNSISKNIFTGNYYVKTELSIIQIDKITLVLIPGEIFPELVWGGTIDNPDLDENITSKNPKSLIEIAKEYNIDNLIILGLANDEIGYIVPPSDFLLNDEYPYLQNKEDTKGENHYEETMSVGFEVSEKIAKAFSKCLSKLNN